MVPPLLYLWLSMVTQIVQVGPVRIWYSYGYYSSIMNNYYFVILMLLCTFLSPIYILNFHCIHFQDVVVAILALKCQSSLTKEHLSGTVTNEVIDHLYHICDPLSINRHRILLKLRLIHHQRTHLLLIRIVPIFFSIGLSWAKLWALNVNNTPVYLIAHSTY